MAACNGRQIINTLTGPTAKPSLAQAAPTRGAAPSPRLPSSGNQALLRRLQPKLTVGPADDPLEREADSVAADVMRMTEPRMAAPPRIARACAACEDETMQPKSETDDMAGEDAPDSVAQTLNSSGRPLDEDTRGFFEPRFNADFSDVRVHTDAQAASSAQSVGATAYTVGPHLVFNDRSYAPGTAEGRQLLAHELTHVVQQGGATEEATAQRQADDAAPAADTSGQTNAAAGAPAKITGDPIPDDAATGPTAQQAPVQRALLQRDGPSAPAGPAPMVPPTVSWSDYAPVAAKIGGMSAQTGYKWTSKGSVITIVFDPAQSWSVTADQTTDLLRHEQYHLNLAFLIANKANAAASTMTTAALLKALDTTLKAQDRSYDIDTNHGLDARMQAMWEKDIDAGVPQFPFS